MRKCFDESDNWTFLQPLEVSVQHCAKCQTCSEACHIYEESGRNELYRPIYRSEILRRIYFKYIKKESPKVHGDIDLNWETVARLIELSYRCNLCRRCAQTCPIGADNALLAREIRHELVMFDRALATFVEASTPATDPLAARPRPAEGWGELPPAAPIGAEEGTDEPAIERIAIGDDANPHCMPGSLNPPAFRPPSSRFQWIAPSVPRHASPAVGNTTTTCPPSTYGVEFACVALKCRRVSGTPRPTSVSQIFLPVFLSNAASDPSLFPPVAMARSPSIRTEPL